MPRIPIAAAAFLAGLAFASPVAAQDGGERINQLIIYGDDPCPLSSGDEITVCARKQEEERYRIPQALRDVASPENDAWNNRVLAYERVSKGGVLSCSPTGGGGWTGCSARLIEAAYAEKEGDPQIRFSELIAAERAKRLATIDAEAEDTQQDVEEAERQYDERKRREREAAPAAPPPGQ